MGVPTAFTLCTDQKPVPRMDLDPLCHHIWYIVITGAINTCFSVLTNAHLLQVRKSNVSFDNFDLDHGYSPGY